MQYLRFDSQLGFIPKRHWDPDFFVIGFNCFRSGKSLCQVEQKQPAEDRM